MACGASRGAGQRRRPGVEKRPHRRYRHLWPGVRFVGRRDRGCEVWQASGRGRPAAASRGPGGGHLRGVLRPRGAASGGVSPWDAASLRRWTPGGARPAGRPRRAIGARAGGAALAGSRPAGRPRRAIGARAGGARRRGGLCSCGKDGADAGARAAASWSWRAAHGDRPCFATNRHECGDRRHAKRMGAVVAQGGQQRVVRAPRRALGRPWPVMRAGWAGPWRGPKRKNGRRRPRRCVGAGTVELRAGLAVAGAVVAHSLMSMPSSRQTSAPTYTSASQNSEPSMSQSAWHLAFTLASHSA